MRSKGYPISLEGAALYHCGPLIRKDEVLSAGPTTSGRMARYTEEIFGLGSELSSAKAVCRESPSATDPFIWPIREAVVQPQQSSSK